MASWWRRRRNQWAVEGLGGLLRAVGVPLLSIAMLAPLVRQVFLGFLELPPGFWGAGVEAVALRAGLVVTGWLSLDVYTVLIRGESQSVLALWPVDPRRVVRMDLLDVALSRWWLLVGGALLLAPVALEGAPALWGLSVLVLAGAFALGLTGSALVVLAAVRVAEDPRWAAVLDLARGNNPRAQAAFLYAPGVVLLGAGALIYQAAASVPAAAAGAAGAGAWVVAPIAAAIVAALPVPGLAEQQWFRGSAVVADIDARYAALADPEEARSVYLDWLVRFLPPGWRPYALNDLRHGWRARRTLVTGAWLLGALALAAGWTPLEAGPSRALLVVVLGAFLVAANGPVMQQDQPEFLRRWLPAPGVNGAAARFVVLVAWSLPIVGGGALAVAFFQGALPALGVAGAGLVAVGVASALATATAGLAPRPMAVYAPLATVCAVGLAALAGAGVQ